MLRQFLSIALLTTSILSSLPAAAKPYMAEKYTDRAGNSIQLIRGDNQKLLGTVVKKSGKTRLVVRKSKEFMGDQLDLNKKLFTPSPNPAPVGTGGSGTRVKASRPNQPVIYPGDRAPKSPTRR
jgi:hypothetical protein